MKLYTVHESKPGEAVPMSVFLDALGCDVPTDKPEDDRLPEGEWYCENQDCVVREVVISSKLIEPDDVVPPKLWCPGCKRLLKFHHWLRHLTLVPVQEKEVG